MAWRGEVYNAKYKMYIGGEPGEMNSCRRTATTWYFARRILVLLGGGLPEVAENIFLEYHIPSKQRLATFSHWISI